MWLPDVNVWLALTFEAHYHHVAAKEWFETKTPPECAFCRLTQQGFLRLATNPSVFKDDAVTMTQAWGLYDKLQGDERVQFLQEPAGTEDSWRKLTKRRQYSHKVWSDAYLVAFAQATGMRNVTFDQGFKDYKTAAPIIL